MSDQPFVQSLERGLEVLRTLNDSPAGLTLVEVAKQTGMTRAAARRFLLTLVELDYAKFDGRTFTLRPRVLQIGHAYLSSLRLPDIALPHLERLAAAVRETTSLTVLDDDEVVYVARVHGFRILTVSIAVGTRLPAYATSTGRVLLAGLDDAALRSYLERTALRQLTADTVTSAEHLARDIEKVRRQGWIIVDQELESGLRSIAAPIRDAQGRVVAAVNTSTHASRTSLDTMRRSFLPHLLETAKNISTEIAGGQFP
ncbi:helix-turn-helix domain-containing protein [Planosporangium flavigriseum]|uniref:IclR family transcriptional regulator n=1 Tax=Planosporangium flavigriseum TaxID=373681 RepID=A0A8J3LSV0_9ACTN|nr:IclR family transcriptional regulator C-terminal domain-containing protein [Planosporangium flavigriseum]NJC67741.1 helix-turn-helix domain-containing protein [Planosporangium flavigriseum]GIG76018.1 IclR family transcriptional regulator [Planosporangium flavigriseum]